jgi:hypothetical protein
MSVFLSLVDGYSISDRDLYLGLIRVTHIMTSQVAQVLERPSRCKIVFLRVLNAAACTTNAKQISISKPLDLVEYFVCNTLAL